MKTNTLLAIFTAASLLMGCSKKEIAGPAGAQGPQGNANVHSQTITVIPSEWSYYIAASYCSVTLPVAIITDDIVATGAVMVYESYDHGTSWSGMPNTFQNIQHVFDFQSGELKILFFNQSPPEYPVDFRVVTISSSGMIPSDVDVTNYEDVKNYFGLAE